MPPIKPKGGTEHIDFMETMLQDQLDSYYKNVGQRIDAEIPQPWFHKGQLEIWNSNKQIVLALCGAQSGKTVIAPWLTLREIQRRFHPEELNDHLVVSPSFTLAAAKLIPEYLRVFIKELGLAKFTSDPVKELRFTPEGLLKVTGQSLGEVVIRFGYARNSHSLESATYKSVVEDEAGQSDFKVESDEAIDRRRQVYRARKFMLTTPYELGWLKTRYHDKCVDRNGQRIEDPTIDLINFHTADNPEADHQEIARQKDILPDWKYQLFYEGKFTRPAGAIYDCFDTNLNIQQARWTGEDGTKYRWEPADDWLTATGGDFGPNNTAMVCLRGEKKGHGEHRKATGRWIVTKVYLSDGPKSTFDNAIEMRKTLGNRANGQQRMPDYTRGGNHTESGARDAFAMSGFPFAEPHILGVEDQIAIVYQALKQGKLLIHSDLQVLIDQFLNYSRELDEYGLPTNKIKDDAKYHFLAATRYIATAIFPMGVGDPGTVKAYNVSNEPIKSTSYIGDTLKVGAK